MYQPKDSFLSRAGCVIVTINYRLGALGFLKVRILFICGCMYMCDWNGMASLFELRWPIG